MTLREIPLENIVGKGENAGKMLVTSIFSLAHNGFTYSKTKFNFSVTFILLSAKSFTLDWSKNFLCGKLRVKVWYLMQWNFSPLHTDCLCGTL